MRLLVLSSHFPGIINNLIHRGFFAAFPGRVFWYGPGEELGPATEPLDHAIGRIQPDLVLVNMKKRVRNWLTPEMVRLIRAPRAMVECDFYADPYEEWYRACEFDRVFFRSYLDARGAKLHNAEWLPFSVHKDWLVNPAWRDGRKPKVTYAGNKANPDLYPVRNLALKVLHRAGLMEEPPRPRYDLAYMKWWRLYLVGLTCGSKFHSVNAKHFIIPAAGAVLLTDGPPGIEQVFPDPSTYFRYQPDCSDLVEVVRTILQDPQRMLAARQRMSKLIRERHTHEARWADLLRALRLK